MNRPRLPITINEIVESLGVFKEHFSGSFFSPVFFSQAHIVLLLSFFCRDKNGKSLGARPEKRAECLIPPVQRFLIQAVVHKISSFVADHQACLSENPEMLGNSSLRDVQPPGESSDAQRPTSQQLDDPKPCVHGENFADMSKFFCTHWDILIHFSMRYYTI